MNTTTKLTDSGNGYIFDKVPPQATALEEAVLGALIQDKNAISIVAEILKPDAFYREQNQEVYNAILSLFTKSQPIDLLTVTEELKRRGTMGRVGGPFYLVELTNRVASSANLEHHARIVFQKHIQRELIRIGHEIVTKGYDDMTDVFELLSESGQKLLNITQTGISRNYTALPSALAQAVLEIEAASNKKDGITGVPSGFADIDSYTAGWQNSDLIIVAARPGMGKTSLTLALAKNAAEQGFPVAVFSLEMSTVQLAKRFISLETNLSGESMRRGSLRPFEWEELATAIERMNDSQIFIDDTPGIDIMELRAKCRRLKMQHDIKLVIVDYLQLMSVRTSNKANREQEISAISRSLKALAKELDIPVIALSQLSRAVETRGGTKRPQLSDLRESGAIEQDADMVTFIYRPEYYLIMEDEEGNSLKGTAEYIISKHRNGALGTVKLRFHAETAKFTNWSDDFEGFEQSVYSNRITTKAGDVDDLPF